MKVCDGMTFQDRQDAGRKLAQALRAYAQTPNTIILSLPRGGVVVGATIAKILHLPHDIVVARKLGAPGNPEFALGAVTAHGAVLLDKASIQSLRIPQEYLTQEIATQQQEAQRRVTLYRQNRTALDVQGKTVIVVDDGIATGLTMRAVVQELKDSSGGLTLPTQGETSRTSPKKIIVAVPVAPPDTLGQITHEVDEVVCLYAPPDFNAVGAYYEHFPQVSDEEVMQDIIAACAAYHENLLVGRDVQ